MTLSCKGCGACCMEIESPPGYQLYSMLQTDDTDKLRFDTLPQDAKQALLNYYQKGSFEVAPCIWLNTETRECRYYDHRPEVCRDFEVGCEACLTWRRLYHDETGTVSETETL